MEMYNELVCWKLGKDWKSSDLMESLNVCVSYEYYVKMVWMPPVYVVMILMNDEYGNNKFGLEM